MKTKILSIFTALALAVGFAACDDHNYGSDPSERGSISFADFAVGVEQNQTEIESKASVDVSDFIVKIINSRNEVVSRSTYSTLPGVLSLPVGDYTVSVESHEVQKAEFDAPYYKGTTSVKVTANTISDAGTVTCRFSSIRVTIRYAAVLQPLLGDDVSVKVHANDVGELVFAKDETRSGYFEAVSGSTTIVAVLTGTVNGKTIDPYRVEVTDAKPGDHRIITFKPKNPNPGNPNETGGMNPGEGVTIDSSVETIDQNGNVISGEENLGGGDRPGQETPDPNDPGTDPNPPSGPLFSVTSETIDMDNVNDALDGRDYVIHIETVNPMAHLYVEIISDYLTESFLQGVKLTTNFDLAEPGQYEEALRGFNFPVGDEVVGKTQVDFNLTPFIPLLNLSPEPMVHQFKLTVVDNKGNSIVKTLKFQSF